MNNKLIGIIGGMGPEATADCYMKITRATKAACDQDHYRIIIDSNAKIPDRTAALMGKGESPVPAMHETMKSLDVLGVEIACMPCITAHYFLEEASRGISYPIVHALVELRAEIEKKFPGIEKIGVLATTGTVYTGLFEKHLFNHTILYPDHYCQAKMVMEAIYGEKGIKSGVKKREPLQLLRRAGQKLIENGAELIVTGCTEVGLVLKPDHLPRTVIDPMEVVARAIVDRAN